ncbi:MAG: hypothetical protein H6832_08210 [Planctomycetes bacterium]|nr:hypothetical protein [Planctomycetota bacterium]
MNRFARRPERRDETTSRRPFPVVGIVLAVLAMLAACSTPDRQREYRQRRVATATAEDSAQPVEFPRTRSTPTSSGATERGPVDRETAPRVEPTVAPEDRRDAPEHPEPDHESALQRARAAGTLAAWDSFLRRHPHSPARLEACKELEARLDEAEPSARAQAVAARARLEQERARESGSGKHMMGIDAFRLADSGEPSRVLMKTHDGEFVSLDGGTSDRSPPAESVSRALDEPTLRYLPAQEHLVLEFQEDDLLGDARSLDRKLVALWFAATKRAGLDYLQTQLTIALPEQLEFDGVEPSKGNPAHMQRRLIHATLSPHQLSTRLDRVPDEHLDWACAVIREAAITPSTPRETTMFAIATRSVPVVDEVDAAARDVALGLASGQRDEIGSRACRWLALLDPSGTIFERAAGEAREHVVNRLANAIEAQGAIAVAFADDPLANEARTIARRRLLERFSNDDDDEDAIDAGTQLEASGPESFTTVRRVRLAALRDAWDSIRELGSEAIVPLLHLLSSRKRVGTQGVADVLASIGQSCPPVPAASELLLEDARVRARIFAARPSLYHLFTGEARAYLDACIDPDKLVAFAQHTPSAAWARLAKARAADVMSRDLLELVEEHKLAIAAHGAGLFAVETTLENLSDHELRIRIVPGLRFDAHDTSAQNMVVTKQSELALRPTETTTIRLRAACANHRRAIPGGKDDFAIARVPADSDLDRALRLLDRRDSSAAVTQAAVWILTDDVRHADLEQVQRVPLGRTRGTRLITNNDILDAFVILEEVGIDLRTKRIWEDRKSIRESGDGWSHPWYTRRVKGT